ncbi:hypothetical protein CsSME_00035071 [Camellia sinensis var. sinensis]
MWIPELSPFLGVIGSLTLSLKFLTAQCDAHSEVELG